MSEYTIEHGDCLAVLKTYPDNSIDCCVTDPPYGLAFMGKKWDYDVPSVEIWREVFRVLKPGGHLLAFAGTKTQHRMAVNIEDAGFEIRDMIAWVYGCLSEDTEIMVDGQWLPYHKATCGRLALCYDVEHETYSWQPITDTVVYDYDDTAFCIQSDSTDQIVSRNHRCLVERGGKFSFALAETLEREARVPVLEGVQEMLYNLPLPDESTGVAKSVLRAEVLLPARAGSASTGCPQREIREVRSVRSEGMEAGSMASEDKNSTLLTKMQWGGSGEGMEETCTQRAGSLDATKHGVFFIEDNGSKESGVERRCDIFPQTRKLQADSICSLPSPVSSNGSEGRVRYETSAGSGPCDREMLEAHGGSASPESQPAKQPETEFGVVSQQQGTQAIRGPWNTRSDMARIVPIHYRGKMWCIKVATGAFVARRNGKVFITGNSGFPKSLDVSKALDKMAGAEREVVGKTNRCVGPSQSGKNGIGTFKETNWQDSNLLTAPATAAAKRWQGWGTALKPAMEPITVARKPLIGTVAENVLEYGTGAINIDGCRIATQESLNGGAYAKEGGRTESQSLHGVTGMNQPGKTTGRDFVQPAGRFPANLIHDGSDEVVKQFPDNNPSCHSPSDAKPESKFRPGQGNYQPQGRIYPEDSGTSAARFFYCAKANKNDRGAGNEHPTVKPTDLMRYLCRLVCPPEGIVLDPFMGSGSTGKAALLEGFAFIGIEREAQYIEIAKRRLQ